jgi:hypothetical protein
MNDPRQSNQFNQPGQPQQPHRPTLGQPMPAQPLRPPAIPQQPRPAIQPTRNSTIDELEPLTLIEEDGVGISTTEAPVKSKIRQFGSDSVAKQREWKRKVQTTGTGATRVKSFHGKYSDQGLEHMDDVINDWLDGHPDVEVKFVTSTVSVFEGKIREPALVLNLWY